MTDDKEDPDNAVEINTSIWGHDVKIYAIGGKEAVDIFKALVDGLEYRRDDQK